MTGTGILLVDLLAILPEEVECYIQAPSLENDVIQKMMTDTEFDYYQLVRLNKSNKKPFIEAVMIGEVVNYFHSMEIKADGKLLFEGYDGIEFGILSNTIIIPEWFTQTYVLTGDCTVSTEW